MKVWWQKVKFHKVGPIENAFTSDFLTKMQGIARKWRAGLIFVASPSYHPRMATMLHRRHRGIAVAAAPPSMVSQPPRRRWRSAMPSMPPRRRCRATVELHRRCCRTTVNAALLWISHRHQAIPFYLVTVKVAVVSGTCPKLCCFTLSFLPFLY